MKWGECAGQVLKWESVSLREESERDVRREKREEKRLECTIKDSREEGRAFHHIFPNFSPPLSRWRINLGTYINPDSSSRVISKLLRQYDIGLSLVPQGYTTFLGAGREKPLEVIKTPTALYPSLDPRYLYWTSTYFFRLLRGFRAVDHHPYRCSAAEY